MPISKRKGPDETTLAIIEQVSAGARARTKRVARTGIGRRKRNQEFSQKRKDAVQYRACRALLWERDRILLETGWSLQWFTSIEKHVDDEDRWLWSDTDARNLFATYREQQLQIAQELEDLAEVFRTSKQFNALVSSLRTRADILDRIVRTGQELGVIHKSARQVEISGKVDVTQLTVVELRAHVQAQVAEVHELLVPIDSPEGTAGVVLQRLKGKFAPKSAETPTPQPILSSEQQTRRKPRVKKLAEES